MDKSLDEIISSKPRAHRRGAGRRSSARTQVLGKAPANPVTRARAAAAVAPAVVPKATQSSEKIIVSNLPGDVNEAQLKDLFSTTVGPLKEVTLHFDASGRSKGIATVTFQKKGDGNKAFHQYNNRLIDGKRPMKIEIVYDPSKPVPLASRVAPAPTPASNGTKPASRVAGTVRGRRPRGRGGARKTERTPKTAADLDAEMEDYTANNVPAAAA